jgi:hypothetical protein
MKNLATLVVVQGLNNQYHETGILYKVIRSSAGDRSLQVTVITSHINFNYFYLKRKTQ